MHIRLKTCEYPGCEHEFPEHYFSNFCPEHNPERIIGEHKKEQPEQKEANPI